MKIRITVLLGLITLSVAGCTTKQVDRDFRPKGPLSEAHEPINRAMIEAYRTEQTDNAIIRQHTLYPYHFEADRHELNTLGMRAVHVLAMHFRKASGPLSVRAGNEPDALYQARVEEVRRRLADAGVDLNRITISDSLPDGDGIASDQIVIINERLKESTALSSDSSTTKGVTSNQSSSTSSNTGMNSGGSN